MTRMGRRIAVLGMGFFAVVAVGLAAERDLGAALFYVAVVGVLGVVEARLR